MSRPAVRLADLVAADSGVAPQLRHDLLGLVGPDHVVPRHHRHVRQARPLAWRQRCRLRHAHVGRHRFARPRDGPARPRVLQQHAHRHAVHVFEGQRRLVEAGCLQPRETVERVNRPRGLLVVLRLHLQLELPHAIARHDRPDDGRRGRVDAPKVARHDGRLLDALLLVGDVDLRLRCGVAGVEDARLAGLARAIGMDDREDLPWRVQPVLRHRSAHRREEVERHEVEVLVQRLQRRHQLLVDTDARVGLAHPHLDVEVPVERLLVGRRLAARDLHHVVVDARQHLGLVVVPEALGVRLDARVHQCLAIHPRRQPSRGHLDARPARELVEVLALDVLRAEGRLHHAPARRIHRLERVHLLRLVVQLHPEGPRRDAEIALEDLVHRVQLVEPARGHRVELVLLRQVRLVRRDSHPHGPHALALQRGDDLLGEPGESLLVGAQHPDARLRGAGLLQFRSRLLDDGRADLGRLAQPRLDLDLCASLHLRQDVGPEPGPELVHLPRDVGLLLEDG